MSAVIPPRVSFKHNSSTYISLSNLETDASAISAVAMALALLDLSESKATPFTSREYKQSSA